MKPVVPREEIEKAAIHNPLLRIALAVADGMTHPVFIRESRTRLRVVDGAERVAP